METLEQKIRYITDYRPENKEEFIQYWPDENGRFSLVAYVNEICDNLKVGNDPIVPAGATKMKLSDLMRIRIEQWQPLNDDEKKALEQLKYILEK